MAINRIPKGNSTGGQYTFDKDRRDETDLDLSDHTVSTTVSNTVSNTPWGLLIEQEEPTPGLSEFTVDVDGQFRCHGFRLAPTQNQQVPEVFRSEDGVYLTERQRLVVQAFLPDGETDFDRDQARRELQKYHPEDWEKATGEQVPWENRHWGLSKFDDDEQEPFEHTDRFVVNNMRLISVDGEDAAYFTAVRVDTGEVIAFVGSDDESFRPRVLSYEADHSTETAIARLDPQFPRGVTRSTTPTVHLRNEMAATLRQEMHTEADFRGERSTLAKEIEKRGVLGYERRHKAGRDFAELRLSNGDRYRVSESTAFALGYQDLTAPYENHRIAYEKAKEDFLLNPSPHHRQKMLESSGWSKVEVSDFKKRARGWVR